MEEESREFKTTQSELEILERLLLENGAFDQLKPRRDLPSTKLIIRLTRPESERMRHLLVDPLAQKGFDEKYEPNELGRTLESLIDRLFIP